MSWKVNIEERLILNGGRYVGADGLAIYLYLRATVRRRPRVEVERVALAAGWQFVAVDRVQIADALQLSISTVTRRITQLETVGWIIVVRSGGRSNVYLLGRWGAWFVDPILKDSACLPENQITMTREMLEGIDPTVSETLKSFLGAPGSVERDAGEIANVSVVEGTCDYVPVSGNSGNSGDKRGEERRDRPVRKIRKVRTEPEATPAAVPDPPPENARSRLTAEDRALRTALWKQEHGRNDELTVDEMVAAWRYLYRGRFAVDDPEMKRAVDRKRAADTFRRFATATGEWNRTRSFLFERFLGWATDFEARKARTPPSWFRILDLVAGRPPPSWAAHLIAARGKMASDE
jgi:hypothetical protein